MKNDTTYYEVLNVSRRASSKTIKAAYKGMALKFHPDKNKSTNASARMQEINEAYSTLSNPKLRREYDASLPPEPQASGQSTSTVVSPKSDARQKTNFGTGSRHGKRQQPKGGNPHRKSSSSPPDHFEKNYSDFLTWMGLDWRTICSVPPPCLPSFHQNSDTG
jgi:DnaJ-class molecular chaperone